MSTKEVTLQTVIIPAGVLVHCVLTATPVPSSGLETHPYCCSAIYTVTLIGEGGGIG